VSEGRLLGIDHGGTRTGLALSDPERITCRPLGVVQKQGSELVRAVSVAARDHGAVGIVVGLPRPLSGGSNQQLETVLSFVETLKREAGMPVYVWDERFTTSLAESGRGGRGPRDDVAACYMLQNYLEHLSASVREAK